MDWESEVACVALGGGGRRLIKLVHSVRTGVEAGVIRPEHLSAIERAQRPDPFLDQFRVPYSYNNAGLLAVAWVFGPFSLGPETAALLPVSPRAADAWKPSMKACPV